MSHCPILTGGACAEVNAHAKRTESHWRGAACSRGRCRLILPGLATRVSDDRKQHASCAAPRYAARPTCPACRASLAISTERSPVAVQRADVSARAERMKPCTSRAGSEPHIYPARTRQHSSRPQPDGSALCHDQAAASGCAIGGCLIIPARLCPISGACARTSAPRIHTGG